MRKALLFSTLFAVLAIAVLAYAYLYGDMHLPRHAPQNATSSATEMPAATTTPTTPATPAPSTTTPTSTNPGLANPASVNCIAVGGTLVAKTRGDGGQYNLCAFDDNRACEEWALMRGECPVGGRKTTGFDTEPQRYCAWIGGETYAVENATCKMPGGVTCNDDALYNGMCPK